MQALPWGPGWASGRDAPQQRHQGSQGPRLCLRRSQPMLIRFNSEFPTQRVPAEGGCRWPPPGWWLAAHSPCNAPTSSCQVSSPGPAPDRLLQPSGGLYRGRGRRGRSLLAGAAGRPAQSRELLLAAPQRRSTLGESQARGRPAGWAQEKPYSDPLRSRLRRPPPLGKCQARPQPRRATSWPRAPHFMSHRPARGLRRLWHHCSQHPNEALGGHATLRLQGHGHCTAQGQGAGHHGSAGQPGGRRDAGERPAGWFSA